MFSATIQAVSRGHRVHCEVLGEFQFTGGTMYLHNQGGVFQSNDPTTGALETIQWLGLQGLAKVSNLGASRLGNARSVTSTLNATDATIKEYFADQATEIRGRRFRFWGQFYDADLQPLDPRFHIYTGIGDRLRMQKTGPKVRTITLMLEDMFVRRRRSASSMVTQSDQIRRDPDSSGFIYVPEMVDKTINLFDANN
ncbi:MAG: hypothetical protein P1V13_22125 [Rhizobiaceae bacterium]|nr:hypothetical protein [Rhizobiaceae bacterium]